MTDDTKVQPTSFPLPEEPEEVREIKHRLSVIDALMQDNERKAMRQALEALDTAEGVCSLVASEIKPSDLNECIEEINAARTALARALGMCE